MNIRTDLIFEENLAVNSKDAGFENEAQILDDIRIEITSIKSDAAAKRINKPKGEYCTIRFPRLDGIADSSPVKKAVVSMLGRLSNGINDNALIVGLGNADITPDALGPLSAGAIIATRHISDELKHKLGFEDLHRVSCITPGVLGKTGIEAADIIKSTVKTVKPSIVIAIDALAARNPENLCRTIQMSDSGIAPGSGVKNERAAISFKTLGVPVIAIGIPTVIDANCLSDEFCSEESMMVTPKEIDLLVSRAAAIVARAINIYFQPSLDEESIESLS